MELIRRLVNFYQSLFIELPDPRTRNLFLVAKPYQGLSLLGLYLIFVFKWGPQWMKNRPPFDIKKILIAYNVVQILLCSILFIKAWPYWGWNGTYKWICEPTDFSNSEDSTRVLRVVYLYFLIKIIDLLDTVFFVLRKKYNQVSFLHVYHHAGMVILIWGCTTYYPGGHGTFVGFVNSFVHVIMYSYYLFSITVPRIRNVIWIKKAVTQMQIIQFLLFVLHMGIIVFIPDCKFPRWSSAVFLPQNLFMLILFTDFYIRTYVRKPKKTSKLKNKSSDDDNDSGVEVNMVQDNLDKKVDDTRDIANFIVNHHSDSIVIPRNAKRT